MYTKIATNPPTIRPINRPQIKASAPRRVSGRFGGRRGKDEEERGEDQPENDEGQQDVRPQDAEKLVEAAAERLLQRHRLATVSSNGVLRHPGNDDATDDRADDDHGDCVEQRGDDIDVRGPGGWRPGHDPASGL